MKPFLFVGGLVVMLTVTSCLVQSDPNVYNYMDVALKVESVEKEEENSIDVAVLGDSETYASFSPLHMWNETGITSYILGVSAQRLCDSYHLLQQVEKKQEVQVVVLETNCLYRDSSVHHDPKDKVMNKAVDVFPILKYHSVWKNYLPGESVYERNAKEERKYKGFRIRKGIRGYFGGEYMIETDKVKEISEENISYLNQIARFCRENEIKLLMVSTPSPVNWNYEKHNAVAQWAESQGVDYLDLNLKNDEINIDWTKETRDAGNHLNYEGAKKVSAYMANYLQQNYALQDHREDPDYEDWNRNYEAIIKNAGTKR